MKVLFFSTPKQTQPHTAERDPESSQDGRGRLFGAHKRRHRVRDIRLDHAWSGGFRFEHVVYHVLITLTNPNFLKLLVSGIQESNKSKQFGVFRGGLTLLATPNAQCTK